MLLAARDTGKWSSWVPRRIRDTPYPLREIPPARVYHSYLWGILHRQIHQKSDFRRMAKWEYPGNSLSGKSETETTMEVLHREVRRQGQILKPAHQTWFASSRSRPRWAQWKSMRSVRDVSQPSDGAFLGVDTSSTFPGGHARQLRQYFGHAFIYH